MIQQEDMESKIDVAVRLRWRWKSTENASSIVSKLVENLMKSTFGAVLEHLGDFLGAKVAQDARWIASGAAFGELGSSLGGILGHFSDLDRDLSKNSGSVKTSNTPTLLMVF